jgi:hypothetical protein
MDEMIVIMDEEYMKYSEGIKILEALKQVPMKIRIYQLPVKYSILYKRFQFSENDLCNQNGYVSTFPTQITDEDVCMLILKAQDFIQMLDQDIARDYFERIQTIYPDRKLICIIEGLTTYFRKCRMQMNRQFTIAVQAYEQEDRQEFEKRKSRTKTAAIMMDKLVVDDFLIQLQVELRVHIVFTETMTSTAESLINLVKAVATRPYK